MTEKSNSLPDWVPLGEGPLLVVMGGSQGALGLNRMVRAVLPELLEMGCRVVHLTGEKDDLQQKLVHEKFVEKAFSNQIPGLFQNADLVISRAGAGAITELSVCGTPAILIPFSKSLKPCTRAAIDRACPFPLTTNNIGRFKSLAI